MSQDELCDESDFILAQMPVYPTVQVNVYCLGRTTTNAWKSPFGSPRPSFHVWRTHRPISFAFQARASPPLSVKSAPVDKSALAYDRIESAAPRLKTFDQQQT